MSRREFDKKTSVVIIKRATVNGVVRCEECHGEAMRHHIDHTDPDAMQIDKSKKLTAEEGRLLCIPCHKEKTRKDVADIAKAKRREAAHLGAKTAPKMQGRAFVPTIKQARATRPIEKFSALPPRSLYCTKEPAR